MRAPSEYGSTMPMPLRITSIARPYGAQPSSTGAVSAAGLYATSAAYSVPNHASDASIATDTAPTVHGGVHHACPRDHSIDAAPAAAHATPAAASSGTAGTQYPSAVTATAAVHVAANTAVLAAMTCHIYHTAAHARVLRAWPRCCNNAARAGMP